MTLVVPKAVITQYSYLTVVVNGVSETRRLKHTLYTCTNGHVTQCQSNYYLRQEGYVLCLVD